MNTISIYDYRNEDRAQRASYRDGKPQEEITSITASSYWGVVSHKENTMVPYQLGVCDVRNVYVKVDTWGDTPDGQIPEVLPDTTDGRIEFFNVDHVWFSWTRKFTENDQTQWELGSVRVDGDSHRKDGSRGSISGGCGYRRTNSLPDWLQRIVDRSHPVTGENSFTFGNEHVYGKFHDSP